LLMAHLPFNSIFRPQAGFNQGTTSHSPESMSTDFNSSVVAHSSQSFINCILAHRFAEIMIANKHEFMVTTDLFDFCQHSQCLTTQRNQMWSSHFRTTVRMFDPWQWHAFSRDSPHRIFKVDLRPSCESE